MWNETSGKISGQDSEIIEALALSMNFSFTTTRSPEKRFSGKDDDGNYIGILGVLDRREADFTSCTMSTNVERALNFELSIVINVEKITLNMAKPDSKMTNIWVYLTAFRTELWLAYGVLVITLGLGAYIILNGFSFVEGINLALVHFLQRDIRDVALLRPSSKLFYFVASFFAYFIFSAYTALLTASMSTRPSMPNIESFSQILENEFSVMVLKGSNMANSFKSALPGSSKHQVYKKMMEGRGEEIFFSSQDQAIQELKANRRKFVFDWITGYIDKPDIIPVSTFKDFMEGRASYILPKGSELIGLFNHHLGKLREAGVMHNIRYKWFGAQLQMAKLEQRQEDSSGAEILGYDNVAFPFLAAIVGLFAAFCLGVLERIHKTILECR